MTFFTADQLVAHAVGDYILQSDWMADNKTKNSWAALLHALTYTAPFALITQSPTALAVILGSHFVIDRWRLARFLVWLKNEHFLPFGHLKPMTATGYQDSKPPFLAVWLLIIADNITHVICNAFAIWCLP